MTALTTKEQNALAECEAVIERGMGTFMEVGNALKRIRDERLYRASHKTFEIYCRKTWGWARDYANKLIGSAGVAKNLDTMVSKTPQRERHVRPLRNLPPEKQREIWERAVVTAPNGRVTSSHVANLVRIDQGTAPGLNDPEPQDPNNLRDLKRLWRQCSKKEKTEFLNWVQESGFKPSTKAD